MLQMMVFEQYGITKEHNVLWYDRSGYWDVPAFWECWDDGSLNPAAPLMRTYSEEKRSGTIELLLTSPLTDFQIIMGKFLGALALYAVMLAVSLIHIIILFRYGTPEWKPIATAYLGLLLIGGCFISLGLFISSLTKNQIVAGTVTFAVFLLLWIVSWIGSIIPGAEKLTSYLSIVDHFDDFTKGVIDTSHLIYYASFITLGLFLTAKSVESERWRG